MSGLLRKTPVVMSGPIQIGQVKHHHVRAFIPQDLLQALHAEVIQLRQAVPVQEMSMPVKQRFNIGGTDGEKPWLYIPVRLVRPDLRHQIVDVRVSSGDWPVDRRDSVALLLRYVEDRACL